MRTSASHGKSSQWIRSSIKCTEHLFIFIRYVAVCSLICFTFLFWYQINMVAVGAGAVAVATLIMKFSTHSKKCSSLKPQCGWIKLNDSKNRPSDIVHSKFVEYLMKHLKLLQGNTETKFVRGWNTVWSSTRGDRWIIAFMRNGKSPN